MSNMSLILSAILTLALVVIIAPNVMAMNRGKALRNIAIWLAIFAALGLAYQTFGPGGQYQMFSQPEGLRLSRPAAMTPDAIKNTNEPASDQGFTPPKED